MGAFLGIDGGGTKTRAIILDETGRLLGAGLGGPSNYDDVGVAATQKSIDEAVSAARRTAGLPPGPLDAAFLGLAGIVSPTDRQIIADIARALNLAPAAAIGIDHDCRIALAGGLSGRPGMVQIAGTGSSTFGVNAAGDAWRAGGWGQLMADEGSGYWFGVAALKAAVRAFDGRLGDTSLLPAVQEALQLAHMDDIMHRVYGVGLSRTEIAALAPLVFEAARTGDGVATDLIDQGARLLADCVLAVARRLGFDQGRCELALVGGLFSAGDLLTQPFQRAVGADLPHCRVLPAELPPVVGAGLLALQQAGIAVEQPVQQALLEIAHSAG